MVVATTSSEECMTVSAPGKVLVAGGYLVLDRPNVGIVLAATARFHTSVKWTQEKASASVAEPAAEAGSLDQRLYIKVESPQFRSVYWYECVFNADGRLPVLRVSPDQASNIFLERTLTYVLGYLLTRDVHGSGGDEMKKALDDARESGRALAIKLRADNDFYSQTSQLRARGLPYTAEALASLPAFLECPTSKDGGVVVAKTGMGSSAALVSSLVGALLSFFSAVRLPCLDGASRVETTGTQAREETETSESAPGMSESLDLTHNLAQACHCVAQGKVGSGFDVSAAIYGTHTYTRFSPSALADALSAGDTPQNIHQDSPEAKAPLVKIAECVGARGGWDAERGQLRLPPCFRLLMGDVCGGSSTPSMVRKVQAWRANPSTSTQAKELWSALGAANTAIAETLNMIATRASDDGAGAENFEASSKVLSKLPATEWTDEGEFIDAGALEQLLKLKASFAEARQLLREVGDNAGVPIEPPVQTQLVDATSALPGVLCAGVPGAGGVDAVFAIVVHPNAEGGVRDLWAKWLVGGDGVQGGDEGAVVCPLLLTASEGGVEGGILCTRALAWE